MGYAAKNISEFADIIDINMGCPAPKVVKNGDGSKLLLDLEKAKKYVNINSEHKVEYDIILKGENNGKRIKKNK